MNYKQKIIVSAIIYVRNCEGSIDSFLGALYKVLDGNFERFEIICVNDASTDKSNDKIKGIRNKTANCMLSIINMSYHQGVEAAMRAGIDLAIGDFVFEFDEIEIDYDPALIIQVYNRSLQGFDIVSCGKGSKRVSSKLFYAIYNRYSTTQYELKTETFRIISRRGINRVHSLSVNIPYRKALYSNCGLKLDYISYKPEKTMQSTRWRFKDPHDTALTSLILYTDIAYKVSLAFTFIMMLATLGGAAFTITVYLMGLPFAGYTTIMLMMSGAFFAIFAILAIVIKYLSVILGLAFHKQGYVIESIEKITTLSA